MAKYFLKCRCGNDDLQHDKEVNLYICTKCNHANDPNFDFPSMVTELTQEDVNHIIKS